MEEFGVGITLTKVVYSGGLPFPRSFQSCKSQNPSFETTTESPFICGQGTKILGRVQLKDDIKRHEKLKLAV
jgi:hypothetical protein